ncbi:MAG TPA: DUF4395 family protein [Thermoanaerobaculia bacterium]|nr:DUF4395 family protein [Thermoanaerobaculia bacterium]
MIVQGWRDDAHLHEIAPWARLAPAVCTLVILTGVWIGTSTLFWILVPLALMGAMSGRHPIDMIYSEIIAPLINTRPLPRCGAPRRFACTVAAVWLMATAIAFSDGPSLLGGVLAGLMAAGMFLTAALDLCLPCYAFVKLFARRRVVAQANFAEDPTLAKPAEFQTTTPLSSI